MSQASKLIDELNEIKEKKNLISNNLNSYQQSKSVVDNGFMNFYKAHTRIFTIDFRNTEFMEAINSSSNEEISSLECMVLLNSLLASNPKYLASKLTEALAVAKLTISEDEFASLTRHRREMENIKVSFADVQKAVESKRGLFKYPDDPQEDFRELSRNETDQKEKMTKYITSELFDLARAVENDGRFYNLTYRQQKLFILLQSSYISHYYGKRYISGHFSSLFGVKKKFKNGSFSHEISDKTISKNFPMRDYLMDKDRGDKMISGIIEHFIGYYLVVHKRADFSGNQIYNYWDHGCSDAVFLKLMDMYL